MESGDSWKRGAVGGTVLRGQDGSLYFIRDEILAAFRVEGEGLERLEAALTGSQSTEVDKVEIRGQAAEAVPAKQIGYVHGSLLRQDARNIGITLPDRGRIHSSTVMCPWFC